MSEHNDMRTVTIVEAARLMGIGKDAAYRLSKSGVLPTIQIGRRVRRVPLSALRRLMENPGGTQEEG